MAMKATSPVVLSPKAVEILKAVYFYRYMGALDVCYRLFTPGALVRVRKTLSDLSGGEDAIPTGGEWQGREALLFSSRVAESLARDSRRFFDFLDKPSGAFLS